MLRLQAVHVQQAVPHLILKHLLCSYWVEETRLNNKIKEINVNYVCSDYVCHPYEVYAFILLSFFTMRRILC